MPSNRLIKETSPYLLQHAHNPVDWYPWGEEALAKAKREDKPILLSIGYSACHWCHVMEHESFEDPEIAKIMNQHFVNVKVDREERPDLDNIYMGAVQAMTGRGGWPMTLFLTPEAAPFYGGTYFPPVERYGMPSFRTLLLQMTGAYRDARGDITRTSQHLREQLSHAGLAKFEGDLDETVLENAFLGFSNLLDQAEGGFGGPPKFPQPMNLDFLLRLSRRKNNSKALWMVELTLKKMARGGIFDQLGGGFHRYSVDGHWLVPHFEKMLYDNALLSRIYLHTYQVTRNPLFRRVVEETLDYVTREMTDPSGGFYSTQDADSEGKEGKFFLWEPKEIKEVVGDRNGELFCRYFDVTEQGNFEGTNILNVPRDLDALTKEVSLSKEELDRVILRCRRDLLDVREKRVKPGRDEKVLTGWNGLMLASFAEAARVLGRKDYYAIARKNANFDLTALQRDGRLLRTWKNGQAKLGGYLEDYAFLADGLLALYQTDFDVRWFAEARGLVKVMLDHFGDKTNGGFFDTSDDHEELITRPKSLQDNAIPSGNAMAVRVLLLLASLTGEARYYDQAGRALKTLSGTMRQYPTAFGHWLGALDFYLGPVEEVALVGNPVAEDTQTLISVVSEAYRPNLVMALNTPNGSAHEQIPLLGGRTQKEGRATAYVCRKFACKLPVNDPERLRSELG